MKRQIRFTAMWTSTLVGTLVLGMPAPADEGSEEGRVDPAELVRESIANENRIHELDSLFLRIQGRWTRSAQAIAAERADLEKRFPPATVSPDRFPVLRPEQDETLELVFDRSRLRVFDREHGVSTHVRIWDGRQAWIHERYQTHEQESYLLDDSPQENFVHIDGLYWLATGAHSFWWNSSEYEIGATAWWVDRDGKHRSEVSGTPEEYVLLGRRVFRGRDCHVLGYSHERAWPARCIYVGVENRRLYGQTSYRWLPAAGRHEITSRIAEASIQDDAAWEAWKDRLPASERQEVERRYATELFKVLEPSSEHYFEDYREVSPGFRIPLRFGYRFFQKGTRDETGTRRDLEIVEWKVNSTLPDELFVLEMREGVQVCDKRHDPPLFYRFKKEFSPAEWQAILDEHEERAARLAEMKARQDSRVDTQAVQFPKTTWVNSKPLTWEDLRGRVVVLDFCAHWCGPCHDDYPILENWHKGRRESRVTVIGVHTPTDSVDNVEKMARDFKLSYPICVDSKKPPGGLGFGFLSSWYFIEGIPHAVVVDQRGRVAGHGSLDEVLSTARLLVLSSSTESEEFEPAPGKPMRIALWNGHAPIGDSEFENADAWITVHRPAAANGTAVVICPGGGYGGLMRDPEGHGIARWLSRHGITGVVLEYRLPHGRHDVPRLDAQRALRVVRANAKAWGIKPSRIGIMGFSAGGHLASNAGTRFDSGDPGATDPIEHVGCRPDFMILVYPVVTMGEGTHEGSKRNLLGPDASPELLELFSSEKQVTARTPPTFLAHAKDDRLVPPENSQAFHRALQKYEVPSRYLELPSGGHGLNGYKGPMWDAWQKQSLHWLEELKLTPPAARPNGATPHDILEKK